MHYTRDQHKKFLDTELQEICEDYLKTLNTEAVALLESNEVYVSQFVKVELEKQIDQNGTEYFCGNGQLLLKFKSDKGIPRKNEYFVAVLLDKEMCIPRNWGNISWGNLRKNQIKFSEVHCVWQGKTDENGFLLCGFAGLSIEMAKHLIDNKLNGCVIVLGPKMPPIDYYQNLINMVSNNNQKQRANALLDYEDSMHTWSPTPLSSTIPPASVIVKKLEEADDIIVQGPPGTGKTYMMANVISNLLDNNKSVLATALTNRALIELASKEALTQHLEKGNIYKTNVSTDELSLCKKLECIESKKLFSSPGKLTLTTFYNSSGWAIISTDTPPFDYVIMDEASQALFAMVASCKNLGKKVIWIGDQKQLPPIVSISEETIIRKDYANLINGFQTLCDNFDMPSYMLVDTFRLQSRSAELTSVFYDVPLVSVSTTELTNTTLPFIDKRGGTSIIEKEMPNGEKADRGCCNDVVELIGQLLKEVPNATIALLSKFRPTVRMLQNCFITRYGTKNNVLIDTVERIQGMTCDICFYFIPNTIYHMSLNKELFNVVTSRAKQYTVIVADKSLLQQDMPIEVRRYLLKAQEDKFATFEPKTITAGSISVSVVDKIDLSKLERRTKSSTVYVIDTNVFVSCPDIISRIGKQNKVIVPAKVLEELDKLKQKESSDKKAINEAAKNISLAFTKNYSKMEEADVSLLPQGFDTHNADCMILSVVLKHKDDNAILLTSDKVLQARANGRGIRTMSLYEILR